MSVKPYYISRTGPATTASRVKLAMQAPYDRLETAFSDMGSGVIFDSQGDIIAFHERHLPWIEHYSARMVNFSAGVGRVGDNMGEA